MHFTCCARYDRCQLLGSGGYAEYVAVDERLLIRIPTGLTYEQVGSCVHPL